MIVNFGDSRLRPSDWAKIQPCPMSGCWLWTGAQQTTGYGSVGIKGSGDRSQSAHRYAYSMLIGPIPFGLHIDHRCGVRCCVNPAHLEAVTQQENNRRAGVARTAARKACRNGHPYMPENTITRNSNGTPVRWCRICDTASKRRHREFMAMLKPRLRPLTEADVDAVNKSLAEAS